MRGSLHGFAVRKIFHKGGMFLFPLEGNGDSNLFGGRQERKEGVIDWITQYLHNKQRN